jgi:hypothetical protein
MHDELPDPAAELRTHDALSRARAQDDFDGLLDGVFAFGVRDAPVASRDDGKRPPAPEKTDILFSHR